MLDGKMGKSGRSRFWVTSVVPHGTHEVLMEFQDMTEGGAHIHDEVRKALLVGCLLVSSQICWRLSICCISLPRKTVQSQGRRITSFF